jgi:glycosyltransferase involved in cell wall biosynthesis
MDFSVIVPCFNSERYLRRCLEALFTQTFPGDRYEVVLIDNNSTDRSLEIARSFPDLVVLQEEIQSSYSARNRGLRKSRGKMLAFTDSDCEACPTWLEEIAASLAEPGTALVLGSRRNARESYSLAMAADYEAQKVEYVCTQDDSSLYYGYTGNLAAHREAFERCGLFMQIARGADTVFVSTVLKTYGPGSVRYAPKAQVRHLEINGVSDWYRKLGTYGRSSANYGAWSHTRPLGLRTRLKVMRRTIARNRYSWLRALSLALLLAVGVAVFALGRIVGSMGRKTAGQSSPNAGAAT